MYWQSRFNRPSPDAELENQIRAIRQRDKDFGYRRICGKLREDGIMVNHKKVQRLVQKLSLQVKSFTNKSRKYNSYKGTCLDNSVMENFFGLLKQEMYYGQTYHSFEELECAICRYIEYYNKHRIKAKLRWLSPVNYRLRYTAA